MEEDIKLKEYSEEEGCCFCFKFSDFSQNQNDVSGSPENIYSSCNRHIKPEYLNEKFFTWSPSMPLPFCKNCLCGAEKLSNMNSRLEEMQKQIDSFVDTFTMEFLESRKYFNKDICTESDIENWFVSENNRENSKFLENDIFSDTAIRVKDELEESAEFFSQSELTNFDLEDHFSECSSPSYDDDIPIPVVDLKPQLPPNHSETRQNHKIKPKVSQPQKSAKSRKVKRNRNFGKQLGSIQVNLRRMEFDSEGNPIPFTELLPRRKAAIKAEETFLSMSTAAGDTGDNRSESPSGSHSNRSESGEESASSWEGQEPLPNRRKSKLVSCKKQGKVKCKTDPMNSNSEKKDNTSIAREKKFKCTLCDKRFFRRRHMRDHEITHDKSKRFQCLLCDMSYAYTRNLRQHLQKHERGELASVNKEKKKITVSAEGMRCAEEEKNYSVDGDRKFKCSQCDKTYKTKYHLNEHERTHFKEKRFQCTYCDMSYAYIRNLRDHFLKRHKKVYPRKKGGRPPGPKKENGTLGTFQPKSYVCKVCGKICNTAGHLFYHRKSHLGIEGEMKCETCNKMFKNVVTLAKHQKSHTDQNRYFCSICGKEFKSKTGKRDHERFHNGEKKAEREKFECPDCHKMYSSRSSLNLHSLRHREVKQFVCPEVGCVKRFSTKGGLNCHAMYHKGEKPYLCEECGKSFYTATKLKAHNRLHTGLLFPCEYCDKGFQTTTHLKQHYRSHRNKTETKAPEPPPSISFSCTTCPLIFTSDQDLNDHVQVHTQTLVSSSPPPPMPMPPPTVDEFTIPFFMYHTELN